MKTEEVEKFAQNLRKAEEYLKKVEDTPFEGVNANVKRALISISQALYHLGKERP